MKKVAILAPTGMLGSMVYNVLKDKYELVLIYRNEEKLGLLDQVYGGVTNHARVQCDLQSLYQDYVDGFSHSDISPRINEFLRQIGDVDAVINCAGIIKPHSLKDPAITFFINATLPHILSRHYGEKLIHITTDCAYSGISSSPYDERAQKSPNDLYGLSKSLGEPKEGSLVLRTSIIGPEIGESFSLIEWFKKQESRTIKGFTSHLWNGITTKQFGKVCDAILSHRDEYPKTGLYHIFSTDVTKYEMVQSFKDKYKVDVTIEPSAPPAVDRRLRTVFDMCSKLKIPSFQEMMEEL